MAPNEGLNSFDLHNLVSKQRPRRCAISRTPNGSQGSNASRSTVKGFYRARVEVLDQTATKAEVLDQTATKAEVLDQTAKKLCTPPSICKSNNYFSRQ